MLACSFRAVFEMSLACKTEDPYLCIGVIFRYRPMFDDAYAEIAQTLERQNEK